jgi:hypothetical protein
MPTILTKGVIILAPCNAKVAKTITTLVNVFGAVVNDNAII